MKISTDGLALLITQEADLCSHVDLCSQPFPVTYIPTKDPFLVHRSLLQLGDVEVQRKAQEEPTDAMELSNTGVLKLQVHRDDWNLFTTSPIKHVITMVLNAK